jgi:hypothetical protein
MTMNNIKVIYEDPTYNIQDDEPEMYVESIVTKDFNEWNIRSQKRLIEDIFSPYNTLNS